MSLAMRTDRGSYPIVAFYLVVAAFLSGQLGCSRAAEERGAVMQLCADATLAKESSLPELRGEIARIEQQGGLPSQLVREPLSEGRNAAAALARVFDGPLRIALAPPLEEFAGQDSYAFELDELAEITRLIDRHAKRIEGLQQAAAPSTARFPIGIEFGFFARVDYLEDAAIACRFELMAAVTGSSRPPIDEVLANMERAARWIGWLAAEPRLEPRLLGCRLRGEWLRVLELIAANPSTTLADYGRLRAVLTGWLAEWPDPIVVLRGDRAAAIHAYEAIRRGLLKQIVTSGEWSRLKERGVTVDSQPAGEALDLDELVYLKVMRRVEVLLRQPYHQRSAKHQNVADMLALAVDSSVDADNARSNPQPAPLAEVMFLPGIPSAIESMAIDRAACEAWGLALSAAGGFELPEHRVNPHSGELYRVERTPQALVVDTGDSAIRNPFALRRTQ